jgi:hypothetical protein
MKESFLTALAVASDPDVVAASAQYMRRMFDALKAQGFSDDQAMQLLVASGSAAKVS